MSGKGLQRAVRILHVLTLVDDDRSYGGPLTVALNHCAELRSRGHDARLAGGWRGSRPPPTELDGVPVHLFQVDRLIPGNRFSGLVAPGLSRWLKQNAASFDVGHVHLARDLVPLWAGRRLKRAGVPYVTQTHGMVMPDGRRSALAIDALLTRRVLGSAQVRFVLTGRERAGLAEVLGPGPAGRSLTSLRNGVVASDRPQRSPQVGDGLDVLFLGRLHPRKRVLDFARAAAVLAARRVPVRFSVVGPDDGDLPALEQMIAADPALRAVLHYEGALEHDQALERLARADVFVLPSVDEPFPMTLLEALAVGTPSVCTTGCGSGAELNELGAVRVVEPGVEPLAAELSRLLPDEQLRAELSLAGTKAVHGRFSITEVVDSLVDHYLNAARRTRPRW